MLEQTPALEELTREAVKARREKVFERLSALQRECRARGVPVLVVVDGWDASGKGRAIGQLIDPLDPRGFRVVAQAPLSPEEGDRPRLWRYWNQMPGRGQWAIWEQGPLSSWVLERCQDNLGRKEHERLCDDLVAFESMHVKDGLLLFKYFLQVSKKEQKKRFKELESDKDTRWRVTRDHWRLHEHYDLLAKRYSQALSLTHHGDGEWRVLDAKDSHTASIILMEDLAARLEQALAARSDRQVQPVTLAPAPPVSPVDLGRSLNETSYRQIVDELQDRVQSLELELIRKRVPVVIAYEGWDAAGKGGNIKRLTQKLDPRTFTVVPIAAPTPEEKAHHYLWRFWRNIPRRGHITIFDRTWYGRVLVERIEGFCRDDEWMRAYEEINAMERQWVRSGTVLIKFWLEIDSETQLKRFEDRQNTPAKQWKITEEDWRNREKAPRYRVAIDEMLARTSTVECPWTVLEAVDKYWARVKALRTVIQTLEEHL